MFHIVVILLIMGMGCSSLSPIDSNIDRKHSMTQKEVAQIQPILKTGDIVFRRGNAKLAGGLVDFSAEVAKATSSRFSHAVLVMDIYRGDAILADITPTGIARRFIVDWHIDGSYNVTVKRLKPEFQFLIPLVLAELDTLIDLDVLYDDKFKTRDKKYYCTELVDQCFRRVGYPLANKIRIRDWPDFNLLVVVVCLIGGINMDEEVVIVGNNEIGLFSSQMLYTIYP